MGLYRATKRTAVPASAATALDAYTSPFLMARAPLAFPAVVLGEEPEDEKLIEGEAVGFIVPEPEAADAVDWEPPVGATELTMMEDMGCPDVSHALTYSKKNSDISVSIGRF